MAYQWRRQLGGDAIYASQGSASMVGNGRTPVRSSFKFPVTKGRYDVRIKRLTEDSTDSQVTTETALLGMRFTQEQPFDVGGQTRLGMTVKASGQVNGAIDRYSALVQGKAHDLSVDLTLVSENPAWWFLKIARGFYHPTTGKLLAGAGLADTQIDIAAISAWADFCYANSLYVSAVFDSRMSIGEALSKIARVGRGSLSFSSGKLGVVWDAPNLAPVALFGPHNMLPGTFSIEYTTEKTADEVIVRFFNSENFYKPDTIRITVPGASTTGQNPAEVDLFGVVYTDQAKREGNLIAAAQLWRRRRIQWETDLEGLIVSRGDVVLLSHDMTSWAATGRVFSAASTTSIVLDKPVTGSGATQWLVFRRPDNSALTQHRVAGFSGTSDTLTLLDPLPVVPGGDGDHHASDYVWMYGPQEVPGKKVKILAIEPLDESRVRVTATDENPEYYACEFNLVDYAPGVAAPTTRIPTVSGLRATVLDSVDFNAVQSVNVQVDWDVVGPEYNFGQVYIKEDNGQFNLIAETTGRNCRFIAKVASIYTIRVVVYGADGVYGGSNSGEIVWTVTQGVLTLEPPTNPIVEEYKVAGPSGDIVYGAKLTWTLSPSPWIASYEVQTFAVGHSVDWHPYGTVGPDTDYMILAPALLGITYQIRVRAVAGNGSYSEWAQATDFYITEIDAPENATVTLVGITPTGATAPVSMLEVAWTPSTDDRVTHYELGTRFDGDLNWVSLGTVDAATPKYHHATVLAGKIYEFRVRAVTASGAFSAWEFTTDFMVPVVAPPTLVGIELVGGMQVDGTLQQGIRISWTPPGGTTALYYEVEGKYLADVEWYPLGTSGTPRFEYRPVISGQTVQVRVRTVDIYGAKSTWAQSADFLVGGDTTPPGPISGLTALGGFGYIQLNWINPTDSDFSHVEIWANSSNDRNFATKIATVSGDNYLHGGLESSLEVIRYYWGRAVDYSGNESDWHPLSATGGVMGASVALESIDTTPPAQVTGVGLTSAVTTGTNGEQIVSLTVSWTAVADEDLAYYEVDLKEGAGGFIAFATGSNTTYSWTVKPGISYTVRVRAVDFTGNLGPYSLSATHTTAVDTVAPSVPIGLAALASVRSIFLTWANGNAVADYDLAAVEVYRNSTNNSGTAVAIATVNANRGMVGGFTDAGLAASTTYYYWVKAVDSSGNKSAFSTGISKATAAITNSDIAAGTITGDRLVAGTIQGDRISTTTSLPGSITVGTTGVTIETVKTNADSGVSAFSGTAKYRTAGAPTNNPTPSGITVTANTNGTANIRLDWGTYTQGALPADFIVLFWRKDGTAPTQNDSSIVFNVNTAASYYNFEGVNPSDTYSFGIAAARKSETGLEIGTIQAPISAPDWRGVSGGGTPNYTANINGSTAATVVTNASLGAQNPATRINAGSTTIEPGKIEISGGTTLASWRNGTDATKIEGGSIAANTISANKISVGLRGLKVTDIEFAPAWAPRTASGTPTATSIAVNASVTLAAQHFYSATFFNSDGRLETVELSNSTSTTVTTSTLTVSNIKPLSFAPASGSRVLIVPTRLDPITYSGTVGASATTTSIPLGKTVTLQANIVYRINIDINGTLYTRRITTSVSTVNTYSSVSVEALPSAPSAGSTWSIEIERLSYKNVAWSSGSIDYYNDAGTLTTVNVSAGSVAWTAGTVYVYFINGSTGTVSLSTTTSAATANGANNAILALYRGETSLTTEVSRTIIDGNQISTGTIRAEQIAANSIGAELIKAGAISADQILANSVTLDRLVSGSTMTMTSLGAFRLGGSSLITQFNGVVQASAGIGVERCAITGSNYTANYPAVVGSAFGSGFGIGAYAWSESTKLSQFVAGNPTYAALADQVNSGKQVYLANASYSIYSPTGKGKHYIVDGAGPFTGFHDGLTLDTPAIGDICVDYAVLEKESISSVVVEYKTSTLPLQKGVIGVCSELYESPPVGWEEELPENMKVVHVNALGEGLINVCGEAGDIALGDLIVTSSTPGKGMKQADDIVRSYTVAKAREAVTFTTPEEVKQVACIYLCG